MSRPTPHRDEKIDREIERKQIVFFDGVCNLCNGAVNWLIDHDSRNHLHFAPLQGETFHLLKNSNTTLSDNLSTIVFWSEGRFFTHSEAVLRTCAALGGVWRLALVGLIIPAFLRDIVYRFIARNRYRWFGKRNACRLPTPTLVAKFLA
jgi:predicted DCC family thiol-disulfide oxidoreductase YuxK